jgi:hypothetical protein
MLCCGSNTTLAPKLELCIGKRFERLIVKQVFRKNGTTFYQCLCDCGSEITVRAGNLKSGTTKSCGCFQKEFLVKRSRKPLGHATKRAVWNYYKRNARIRNLVWELSDVHFGELILGSCFYCNSPGKKTCTKNGDYLVHNGIDRLDNNQGYVKGNCVSCCKICNLAKNNLTVQQFRVWVESIYKRFCYENVVHVG